MYVIATFPIKKYDIEQYPAIKKHLLGFGYDRLKQTGDKGARKKTNNQWFETQDSIGYWDDFSKQKIVWGEISDKTKFAIDLEGKFATEATTFLMTDGPLLYLLGFLNSRLSEYLFAQIGTTTGVGTVRWKKFTIERLRVPKISSERQQKYEEKVVDIVAKQSKGEDCSGLLAAVDRMIYEEYSLSEDEIEVIEKI